jgi:hypothetical protein
LPTSSRKESHFYRICKPSFVGVENASIALETAKSFCGLVLRADGYSHTFRLNIETWNLADFKQTRVGKLVAKLCSDGLKKVTLELGGNCP